MATQRYTVTRFSPNQLYGALSSSRCNPGEVAELGQAQYLGRYLTDLDARTIVVEHEYTDGDYLEDFATYYVKCFEGYERRCKRVHFFSHEFDDETFKSALLSVDASAIVEALQGSYLGFVVARPLPSAIVGRTILKTYPSDGGRRQYTAVRKYSANLFGLDLSVCSLVFQEQDTVLAACATVALWCAFHKTADLFGTPAPRPATITRVANGVVNSSRPIPSHGLSLQQMCLAVRDVGLDPEIIPIQPSTPLVSLAKAYLDMGLPVILVGEVEGNGAHAITLTGYSLRQARVHSREVAGSEPSIPMSGLRINEFYGHDDQIGPFARLQVRPPATNQPVSFDGSWTDKSTNRLLAVKPLVLLIPIYNKIRVTFLDVLKWVTRLQTLLPSVFSGVSDLEWDVQLVTINQHKRDLRLSKLPVSEREHHLLEPQPRFLWRARLCHSDTLLLELLTDATDMERSFPVYAAIWPHKPFRDAMATILNAPPLQALLAQVLTKRFLDLLSESASP